jgi:hypothetical protein
VRVPRTLSVSAVMVTSAAVCSLRRAASVLSMYVVPASPEIAMPVISEIAK